MAACLKFCRDSRSESHQEFCLPSRILLRFAAGSRRQYDWLTKIYVEHNTRIICGRIAPRLLLLGENLGEICGRILARFWPPGISLPSENLVGIRARFPPGRKLPAAKILPGSQRDPAKVTLKMLVQRIIALSIKIWFHCKLYKVWV